MTNTIRQRILTELSAAYPSGLTHADLAVRTGAPEASVRRTLQTLRRERLAHFWRYVDSSATDMLFVAGARYRDGLAE